MPLSTGGSRAEQQTPGSVVYTGMKYRTLLLGLFLLAPAGEAWAQLRGSPFSMRLQHRVARTHNFTFLRNSRQVRAFIEEKRLVRLPGNGTYSVKRGIAFPYARPAVKLFVERLAAQFHAATGEKLVITSLTRPISRQPRNASDLSVHPAGMAVDFRVPAKASSRRWLERTLVSLEKSRVLDVTKERRPAHYHVAVFPSQYAHYVERLSEGN